MPLTPGSAASRRGPSLRAIIAPLLAAGLLAACGGEIVTSRHLMASHQVDRVREMPYLLWLPDGYDPQAEPGYPLIVSLHGTGSIAYSTEFVMTYGLPAVLAQGDQPAGFEFVVVSPQGLDAVDWWDRGQPQEVGEIVDQVSNELAIDETRVYLTGISSGGQGAWHLAVRDPERYAAVVSVAGSGFRTTGELSEAACGLAEVPVWGIHGEDDLISVHDIVREDVTAYERLCDASVKWTSYPGVGHYETWEIAYRDQAVYDWMLQHTGG